MKKLKPNDLVVCINDEGLVEYGIKKGEAYNVASIINIPGQGHYIGIVVAPDTEAASITIVDRDKFEQGSQYFIKLWPDTGDYEFVDYAVAQTPPEEEDRFVISRVTLPNSKLGEMEDIIRYMFTQVKLGATDAAGDTAN